MAIIVSILQKNSYKVWTLSNQKMSNFHFDLSLKREVHDFSREMQKFSREVQTDLRGGAHLPHRPSKSGHAS
jgi:hypothetical protein